jgi:DNA-binding response OmpR family regulator
MVDGSTRCSSRRSHGQMFQMIILTTRDLTQNMVRGLETGADDLVSRSGDHDRRTPPCG